MTAIKICGITSLEDALAAAEFGCDYLGFNFYPASPRYIDPLECEKITFALAGYYPGIKLAGIFVNAPVEHIKRTLDKCHLHLAQLHGDEPEGDLVQLEAKAYKAFRGRLPESLEEYVLQSPPVPAFLLDSAVPGAFGGTGKTGDWQTARAAAQRYPLFLAGGLNPENVAAAIHMVRPWGVDTASGVEAFPGKKDYQKLKAFIDEVRKAR